MLSEADQTFIFRNGWMIDHDWELFSYLLGNPLLVNGLLCYLDKAKLSICGWPITQNATSEDGLKKILLDTIDQLVEKYSPDSITLWGPVVVSPSRRISGLYKKSYARIKDANNVHLQIRLADYSLPYNKRFVKQANNVYKNGVVCEIERGGSFTKDHTKIMQTFLAQESLPSWDAGYVSLASTFSPSSQTRQFKALKEGNLLGYIMVREIFLDCAIMTWSLFDKSEYRISDFLYLRAIEHYLRSDIKFLDLGYTVNSQLLNYKTKWDANINNGGYYVYTYAKIS